MLKEMAQKKKKMNGLLGNAREREWKLGWIVSYNYMEIRIVQDEPRYLVMAFSKHGVEGVPWFLLPVYSKMWEERKKLRELLS